jgi:hypothetical protein
MVYRLLLSVLLPTMLTVGCDPVDTPDTTHPVLHQDSASNRLGDGALDGGHAHADSMNRPQDMGLQRDMGMAIDLGRACTNEMCNEQDDDCDGHVDENPCMKPNCPPVRVTRIPDSLAVSPFYTQYVDAGGIPILGGGNVPTDAFRVAYYVIAEMLAERPCYRRAMIEAGIRVAIFGPGEVTTDLPEYSDFYEVFPGTDWDNRGRGYGATLTRPLTSVGYDNLMQDRNDPWFGESILVHEWAHTLFEFGIREQSNGLSQQTRLEALYDSAMSSGRWAETYAATNEAEYWAECVQSYFNTNLESNPPDGIHNQIDTRVELQAYDPNMAGFIEGFFPLREWVAYCALNDDGSQWVDPTPMDLRPHECSLRHTPLSKLECETSVQSEQAEVPVDIMFVNRRLGEAIRVEWIDYAGVAQPFTELPGRSTQTLQTFESHPWRILDESARCLGVYRAGDTNGRVIIE